jgi:hypothetical protein
VWHASVAGLRRRPHKLEMRGRALVALAGVGDKTLGEWHEWTGRAYHVRRRLTAEEQSLVGEAIDLRGTDEWAIRYEAAKAMLPAPMSRLAFAERRKL